jgi:predicted TIM-barrel fold metal-dependent hydrolase
MMFYTRRTLNWLILSGVFERFPRLKFVLAEQGGGWVGDAGKQLDGLIKTVRSGQQGEMRFTDGMAPPRLASEYIHQNVYLGVSFASKWDVERRDVVAEGHWMWGSDFPHDEATTPFTREHLRISMEGVPTEEKRKLLAANAAALYDFDLAALDAAAAVVGPTVEELDRPMTDAEMPEKPNMALRGADGRQAAERAASRV